VGGNENRLSFKSKKEQNYSEDKKTVTFHNNKTFLWNNLQ